MQKPARNYAFIDCQNINLGVQGLGWRLDWKAFRDYRGCRHAVGTAYLFLGYQEKNRALYNALCGDGYELVFKEVTYDRIGKPKGNVDAELVLQAAAIDYERYEQAVIVTSDGDFACLVRFLRDRRKLRAVLSPAAHTASVLLKRAAGGQFDTLAPLRRFLELKKRNSHPEVAAIWKETPTGRNPLASPSLVITGEMYSQPGNPSR